MKRVAGVVVSLLALTWSALAQARTVPLAHPPAGPTRAHPVATLPANGGVVGDGRRYAVIDLGDRLRVINTATGSAYLLVTPCSPESASFGRFLVACPQPDRTVRYSILDAHRRTLTVVPGATPRATLGPIGRHWIPSTGNSSVGEPIAVYINWRTGKRRGFPARNGCYVMRNIDTRDLRPPRGRPDPCATYWFDGLDSVSVARPKFALVLNHLGERTVLSRKGCTTACGPMIGGGRVTWVERTGDAIVLIRGYEVATRERRTWSLGQFLDPCEGSFPCPPSVTHTSAALFVLIPTQTRFSCHPEDGRCEVVPTAYRLYEMSWPRPHRR